MKITNKEMKLYTKEDFLKAAKFCEVPMIDARYIIERIDEVTDPIELPSDEEIEEIADACHPFAEQIGGDIYVAYRAFKQGLQLMRDKIQGGNK